MQPHILFLNRTAHTLGGAATWLDYIEPGLRNGGWRVSIGLLQGRQFHRPERYLEQHPHQEWVRISCTTGTPEGRRDALRRAIQSIQPDLVITLNVTDAVVVVGECRSAGLSMPRIAMSAQMIDEGLLKDIADWAHVLDAVICTNELTRQLVITLGGMAPERVCYGPYGVSARQVAPPRHRADRLSIFYVGRIDWPDKRVHDIPLILDALDARSVPFELTVIGLGPDEAEFRRRIQPWIHNGSARLLGRLAPEDTWTHMHPGRDVLLLTSWTDTGPFVVYEAMARNVAVVSSRYYGSGLERALRHEETGMLFPIGDASAAADCLMRLWAGPDLYQRLVSHASHMVRDRYAIDHSCAVWNRIFQSILHLPQPVGSPGNRQDHSLPEGFEFSDQRPLHVDSPPGDGDGSDENDEWPLTLARVSPGNPSFWDYVAKLDAR